MSVDFATTLAALKQRFTGRAAQDLDVLIAFRDAPTADPATLKFTVHRLAGAAATFGFPALSEAAAALEGHWQSRGEIDPNALTLLIEELRKLAEPDQTA